MGSSGTIALRNGVVASVILPSKRGMAMGWIEIGTLCAPAVGPLIGGVLTAKLGAEMGILVFGDIEFHLFDIPSFICSRNKQKDCWEW